MTTHSLQTTERTVTGKKVRALRREGFIPAHVYGSGFPSRSIQVESKKLRSLLKEVGETTLVDLFVGETKLPVLVQNVQREPVSGNPLHVDFYQVNLKEKVTAPVAVEMVGEALAEKSNVGLAVLLLNEIEVEALPTDLPEKFEVDISELAEIDQAIYVSDLKVDRNRVTINVDPETIVVKVEAPHEEPEPETPTEGEEGATSEGGETPAEGDETKEEGGEASDSE